MKINKNSDWFGLVIVVLVGVLVLGCVQAVQKYQAAHPHFCQNIEQQRHGSCVVSSKDCMNNAQEYVPCDTLHP